MRSATNARRHEPELLLKANDLITAKDAVRIVSLAVAEALAEHVAAERAERERESVERSRAFDLLPWWRRFLRGAP